MPAYITIPQVRPGDLIEWLTLRIRVDTVTPPVGRHGSASASGAVENYDLLPPAWHRSIPADRRMTVYGTPRGYFPLHDRPRETTAV